MFDPDDLAPLDRDKARTALDRVELREVHDPEGPEFAAAYELLASFFAARGELEPRAALQEFVRDGLETFPGVASSYHLVGAWEGDELVGVRDCYVDVDLGARRCLVALAHALVVPRWRRRGLAGVLRALPVTLGRHAAVRHLGAPVPTLVVAEMEPADPADPDTVVRLVAYGRSGFGVLDPARLPYSQPDLRDEVDPHFSALPLLGVVRTVGVTEVTPELAASFPLLFHVTHDLYLPPERVAPSRDHALHTLAAGAGPVAVLPLPTSPDDLSRLRPLVRSAVLAYYPPGLRGPDPHLGDAEAEFRALSVTGR
jgi:hypothetical protein